MKLQSETVWLLPPDMVHFDSRKIAFWYWCVWLYASAMNRWTNVISAPARWLINKLGDRVRRV